MANSLAPGFIKLFYQSNGNQHIDTIPIQPSGTPTPGSMPNITDNGLNIVTALAGVTAYVNAVKGFLNTASAYTGWEFYSQAVGSDPVFIYGGDLNIPGTSATAIVVDSEIVASYRSGNGGTGKLYIMEGTQAVNQRVAGRTGAAAPIGGLYTYLLGATNIRICRDGGRPISGLWYTTKTNDALRKKRLLDN